ncbi:MAG: hypothetical protein JNK27_00530 [Chitinophagaceae bacterium]|nr:hypothetical protein [Chitinophagaceae bacterium]
MKTVLLATIVMLLVSCKKGKEDTCTTDLAFNKITISNNSSVATGIQFQAEAYGANLCFSFSRYDIQKMGDKTYDIYAEASIPCGQPVCAQALYFTSNTGKIEGLTAGTYTLRFYNNDNLFTSLSVTIN